MDYCGAQRLNQKSRGEICHLTNLLILTEKSPKIINQLVDLTRTPATLDYLLGVHESDTISIFSIFFLRNNMVIVNPMFCTFVLKNELRKKRKASENPPRGLRSQGKRFFYY